MSESNSISLNGEPFDLQHISTISDLVKHMGLQNARYAIEVNLDIVPRSEHETFQLSPGDEVEVVQAIGGG